MTKAFITQLCGLIAMAKLLGFLRTTAGYLSDSLAIERSALAFKLLIFTGALGLGVGAFATAGGLGVDPLILAALVTLFISVYFLVIFVGLALGLARGMDATAPLEDPEGADPERRPTGT
jgi:hypothetical protein